jgi:hypothetical protein
MDVYHFMMEKTFRQSGCKIRFSSDQSETAF